MDKEKAMLKIKKKVLTKKELNEIKLFLDDCSKAYYNTDNNIIDDTTYDYIYERYLGLGGEEIVGAEVDSRVAEAEHKYKTLVGTTLKGHNKEDLKDWLIKVYKILKKKPTENIAVNFTLKYDGCSILIEYFKDGKVKKALTRGKNGKGKDLTKAFKSFCVPVDDCFQGKEFAIKYECLIKYSSLERLREETNKPYKNPRNTIAGIVNGDNATDYKDYFTLKPLWIQVDNTTLSREDELDYELNNNFDFDADKDMVYCLEGNIEELVEGIDELREEVIKNRDSLDFMIDGIVIDIDDKKYREKLGYIDGGENLKPRWCIAIKFPYMVKESTITDIKFTMGDSGIISPVAYFDPVIFNGNTYFKQALHGYNGFKELGLAKGSKVLIELRNDVLTYISRVNNEDKEKEKDKAIPFTKVCPICGEPITINKEKTFAYCMNEFCDGKVVGKINNYLVTLSIKGISTSTIQKMYEANLWNNITDLYNFNIDEAYDIDGLGQQSVDKIVRAIEKKNYYDYEILAGMGIKNIGLDTAKNIIRGYELEVLLDMTDSMSKKAFIKDVSKVEGVSNIIAEYLYDGLIKYESILKFLINRGYKKISDEENFDEIRYTFVVTGDLKYCSREELKKRLETRGHKMTGSVTSKTDYLITNTPRSGTVKNKTAQKLGKPIITEDELYEMLNLDK